MQLRWMESATGIVRNIVPAGNIGVFDQAERQRSYADVIINHLQNIIQLAKQNELLSTEYFLRHYITVGNHGVFVVILR